MATIRPKDEPRVTTISAGDALLLDGVTTRSIAATDLLSYAALSPPQGRLTLQSGVAVMAASQAAQSTVLYTPYAGNLVPIYDGTFVQMFPIGELSQLTTDATKSPAAVAASKVYDMFLWNDAGTIRLSRGPAWSSATVRGYTLAVVNGLLLNTSAIANGPAALRGTYVGTIASNAGATIDFIFGTAGASGVAGAFNVWNAYNRVDVGCQVIDTAAAYTYNSNVVRQAHASVGMQVSFVIGLAEDRVFACYSSSILTVAVSAASVSWGIGFDSITTYSQRGSFSNQNGTATWGTNGSVAQVLNPQIGSHYVAALEASDGAGNANTFNASGATAVNGLSFGLRM